MNPNLNAYNRYRATAVTTARPEKLLLMLYDGLILNLKRGKEGIESNDFPSAHHALIKAQEIISELISTLKMEYEVSHNLYQLYDYMRRKLIAANVKKDPTYVTEVMGLASELRSTWMKAAKLLPTLKSRSGEK